MGTYAEAWAILNADTDWWRADDQPVLTADSSL